MPTSAKRAVVFVPALRGRLGGKGKMLPRLFMPTFTSVAMQRGYDVKIVNYPRRFIFGPTIPGVAAIIAIYNEEMPSQVEAALPIERRAKKSYKDALFIPRTSVAQIIGNKHAANSLLGGVVPMPASENAVALGSVFSNAPDTNGAPVQILSVGDVLDSSRYNTKFIDTVQVYESKRYYVCLRAMCVGTEIVGLFVRARPESDGSASVHDKDTPLDAALLNYLHEKLVVPYRQEIARMCNEIGKVLGFGFYAHDILPERDTGKFYLCESGVKFNDDTIRGRLWSIRNEIAFGPDFLEAGTRRAAEAFFDYLTVADQRPEDGGQARTSARLPATSMPA